MKIDEIANEKLNGEILKNAKSFIAFLRENRMSFQQSHGNAWNVKYKKIKYAT